MSSDDDEIRIEDADDKVHRSPPRGAFLEPNGWQDGVGRALTMDHWMECVTCAKVARRAPAKASQEEEGQSNAEKAKYEVLVAGTPEYDELPEIYCNICNLPSRPTDFKAARRCMKCQSLVCDKCAQQYATAISEDISVDFTTDMRRLRMTTYRSGCILFVTAIIFAALAFAASWLVPQDIFTRTLVWYSQCNAPGADACFLPVNSYDTLRTADGIANSSKFIDENMDHFRAWMDLVGMTTFALDLISATQVGPVAYELLGYNVNSTFTTLLSDVYTDELPFKIYGGSGGIWDLYNLSVTVISATKFVNGTSRLKSILNATASALTTPSGFSLTQPSAIDLSAAPPVSNLTYSYWGLHGPQTALNYTKRSFMGLTSPWSVLEVLGPDVILFTRMNVTTPLGQCLDKDPEDADLGTQRIGFVRTTSCYLYGQEYDIVPPWFFILAAAAKNVIMIFVVQRFLAWFIGGIKRFFRGGKLVRMIGPKAVAWTENIPLPRIVQRMELFHTTNVFAASADKVELHKQHEEEARRREAESKGEEHVEGGNTAEHAVTDFANADFVVVNPFGKNVFVGLIKVEDFLESDYYALRRTEPAWVKQWFVNEFIPNHPLGQFTLMNLSRAEERRNFPLSFSDMKNIVAGHWSHCGHWGSDVEYAKKNKQVQKMRSQLRSELPTYFNSPPERKMFPAIRTVLADAKVPAEYIPQLHDVIARDLWAMCHFGYDYGTQLNTVFSKQTVLLYAIVYFTTHDDAALQAAGLLLLADSVQLATPARMKIQGVVEDEEAKADNAVSRQEYYKLVRTRDSLVAELSKCSERRKNFRWDEPNGPETRDPPSADEGFGGPSGSPWRFYEFITYFRLIFLAMPQARGFLAPEIQLAHHVVRSAYPNTFFVAIGFVSSFAVMLNAAIGAHQLALKEIRTVILAFMHRWVNTGNLVSNLTYTVQLRSIPTLYGVDPTTYQTPVVHSLYVGITLVACISAFALSAFGLPPSLFILFFVGGFFLASVGIIARALELFARAFDATGTGTSTAFIHVAYQTVLVSFIFGLFIQTTNNVGYALVLDLFAGNPLPTDPAYWLYNAVGNEYLGRRLSCTIEHMALDIGNLFGMLSYLALP